MTKKAMTMEALVAAATRAVTSARLVSDAASPGPWVDKSMRCDAVALDGPTPVRGEAPLMGIEDGRFVIAARELLPLMADYIEKLCDEWASSGSRSMVVQDLDEIAHHLSQAESALDSVRANFK